MEQSKYRFSTKLFVSLVALSLVPFAYQLVRTRLIASIPDTSGLSIAGHIEWFDLINETLQAFLIVPLYSLFNKVHSDKERFRERIAGTAVLSFVIYIFFSVIILVKCRSIVSGMGATENVQIVTRYLQLETVGFIVGIIASFAYVLFVVIEKARYVYILLALKTAVTIVGDLLLIPSFGVNGIAYSNIAVSIVSSVCCVVMLKYEDLLPSKGIRLSKDLVRDYVRVGLFSGGQILLDNIIYACVVCKMVNEVAEQGNYWVANNVIWGLLLIPVSAMSEVVKKDCADRIERGNIVAYLKVCMWTFLMWGVFLLVLNPFLNRVMGISNYNDISHIIYVVLPFYIAYTISQVISSIFIGKGETWRNAIVSVVVNLVYYPIVYLMVRAGIFMPSIDFICIMFGMGMVINMVCCVCLWWRSKLRVDINFAIQNRGEKE
ncbi:MAG: hypothetical protein NC092_13630 [Butyrivibrio sp.]|nr:hypothetical protein [Muribaculum sp.]MCM1553713.1 hypothetical protein [Butyrivibrio sp.]